MDYHVAVCGAGCLDLCIKLDMFQWVHKRELVSGVVALCLTVYLVVSLSFFVGTRG